MGGGGGEGHCIVFLHRTFYSQCLPRGGGGGGRLYYYQCENQDKLWPKVTRL